MVSATFGYGFSCACTPLRTLRTPCARCSPLQTYARALCCGRIDPSTIRRQTTPDIGCPLVVMFMVTHAQYTHTLIAKLCHSAACLCHTLAVHEAGGQAGAHQ